MGLSGSQSGFIFHSLSLCGLTPPQVLWNSRTIVGSRLHRDFVRGDVTFSKDLSRVKTPSRKRGFIEN